MGVFMVPVRALSWLNGLVLALAKGLAAAALAVMVGFILAQVFYRYVMNNALPWPDEAARFMMLWMTGLAAPAAYRVGGFVAIDMLEAALPRRAAAALALVLLALSLVVLLYAVQIGWREVTGFAGSFKTASLYTLVFPSWSEMSVTFGLDKMPRSHMMASLLVGLALLIVVNVELILRQILALAGHEPPPLPQTSLPEAE